MKGSISRISGILAVGLCLFAGKSWGHPYDGEETYSEKQIEARLQKQHDARVGALTAALVKAGRIKAPCSADKVSISAAGVGCREDQGEISVISSAALSRSPFEIRMKESKRFLVLKTLAPDASKPLPALIEDGAIVEPAEISEAIEAARSKIFAQLSETINYLVHYEALKLTALRHDFRGVEGVGVPSMMNYMSVSDPRCQPAYPTAGQKKPYFCP